MAVMYTLLFLLMTALGLYPPAVFRAAGLTLAALLGSLLGSETDAFIQYHVLRACATAAAHASLPLAYLVGLPLAGTTPPRFFLLLAALPPLYVLFKVRRWRRDSWGFHPVCSNLYAFRQGNETLMSLANEVNNEYKSIDKVCLNPSTVNPTIVTVNWIIQVGFYTLRIARQRDAVLIVKETETHSLSPTGSGEQQFINIEVKPISSDVNFTPFNIRLNTLDFKDLENRVSRPIVVLPHIVFHKSVLEKFIDVFKEQVDKNERYVSNREPDPCFGCMVAPSNVKIFKRCLDGPVFENPEIPPNCELCRCRPMWCVECLGRWFGTRQDPEHPEIWLECKCTCPLCRQVFCLLDVCYVDLSYE